MSENPPLQPKSEISQHLSCLPEKFVVDFANGIDVTRDHLRMQRDRGGMFARLYDGFTGQGARRQTEINASLTDGVEASLKWLTELTESLARSNLAISQVNDRVSLLKLDVAEVADYAIQTRRQIEQLSQRLSERCGLIEAEVMRIDFVQRAQLHLDHVFNKWRAGRYHSFSLSGRCYAALEELRWGDFGDYCRSQPGLQCQRFIQDLANRAISQLSADTGMWARARMDTNDWLAQPSGRDVLPDAAEALAYMGEALDPDEQPLAYVVSQQPSRLPLCVPLLSTAERVAESLVSEVFAIEVWP